MNTKQAFFALHLLALIPFSCCPFTIVPVVNSNNPTAPQATI
jgi:hypothetical protein